jgi:hypothetical protein
VLTAAVVWPVVWHATTTKKGGKSDNDESAKHRLIGRDALVSPPHSLSFSHLALTLALITWTRSRLCPAPTALLLSRVLLPWRWPCLRKVRPDLGGLTAAHKPANPSCPHVDDMTLVKLTEAVADGAVCLDGSPIAYYIRRNVSSDQWVVFFQGGKPVLPV